MIILLDSHDYYMVLTLKKWLYKKLDYRTINELNYINSAQRVVIAHNTQRVVIAHNATHLIVWSVNLVLLQI
jgi:hypothetical protein